MNEILKDILPKVDYIKLYQESWTDVYTAEIYFVGNNLPPFAVSAKTLNELLKRVSNSVYDMRKTNELLRHS